MDRTRLLLLLSRGASSQIVMIRAEQTEVLRAMERENERGGRARDRKLKSL